MRSSDRPDPATLERYANLINNRQSAKFPAQTPAQELLTQLDYHGITLLAGRAGKLEPELARLIDQRKTMMVANELLKQRALTELFSTLSTSGLDRIILFKGTALAYSVYPEPWLRPRSDVDCLIDHPQLDQFEDVLTTLGYQKQFAIEGKYLSYQTTFSKALSGQSTIHLDLHWRINNRQTLAHAFNVGELLQNAQTLSAFDTAVKIPSPVDSLLIAALHRLGHHHGEERLAWLYDIHLLTQTLNTDAWPQLAQTALNKQLAGVTLDALQYCQQLLNTDVPPDTVTELELASQKTEPSQIFLQRDLPEWRYFLHDLKGLPSLAQKLRVTFEHLLPSPGYIRQRMRTRSAVVGYIKRLLRGLKRIVAR